MVDREGVTFTLSFPSLAIGILPCMRVIPFSPLPRHATRRRSGLGVGWLETAMRERRRCLLSPPLVRFVCSSSASSRGLYQPLQQLPS